MKRRLKLFVLRKYVLAPSAAEAIRRERRFPIDDVWLDDDWKKAHPDEVAGEMGFKPSKRR